MPTQTCTVKGKKGRRWGSSGKCYTGSNAEALAQRQGRAARASGFVENQRAPNPLRADPTRTTTLRRIFIEDLRRRFKRIRRAMIHLIEVEDAFGLKRANKPLTNQEQTNDTSSTTASSVGEGEGVYKSNKPNGGSVRGGTQDSQAVETGRRGGAGTTAETILNNQVTNQEQNDGLRQQETRANREEARRASNGARASACTNSSREIGRTGDEEESGSSIDVAGVGGASEAGVGNISTDIAANAYRSSEPGSGSVRRNNQEITKGKRRDTAETVLNTRWRFQTTQGKVKVFEQWLATQTQIGLAGQATEARWEAFVRQGYEKGAARAFDDVRTQARAQLHAGSEQLAFYEGTREEFLRSAFAQPESIGKVKLLAGRTFTDLQGVSGAMSTDMTRIITEGFVQGKNALVIGRELAKSLDINRRRAERIARTEIIRAHAEGQLDAMEELGVEEVGVMVEWSTAGDDRVCPLCQPLQGDVLKIKEARGILPRHPNCRCSFIPANVGEAKDKKTKVNFTNPKTGKVETKFIPQKRSKGAIQGSFNKSIKREIPKRSKRTIAQQKNVSRWGGADKTIAKVRPKSALDEFAIEPPKPPVRVTKIKPVKVTPRKVIPTRIRPKAKKAVEPKRAKPKKAIEPKTQLDRSLDGAEKEIWDLNHERSLVFDENGKLVSVTEGSQTSTKHSLKLKQKIQESGNYTTIHNHPKIDGVAASFSPEDINGAILLREAEMRVVTQDGVRYSMKVSRKIRNLPGPERVKLADQVTKDYDRIFMAKTKQLVKKVKRGELLLSEAEIQMARVSHDAWVETARLHKGLRYNRLENFKIAEKDIAKQLVARQKKIISPS